MRGLSAVIAALCLMACGSTAREARPPKTAVQTHQQRLIAVLPLDARHADGKLSAAAQASLEEMIRDAAVNMLSKQGWTVLTGENTLRVLEENGIDPATCGDQNCHLSMAKEIKAEQFLSGAVQYVDGEFTASIRLVDTTSGKVIASERLNGPNVRALRFAFESNASAFFQRAGLLEDTHVLRTASLHAPPRETNMGRLQREYREQCDKGILSECTRLAHNYLNADGVREDLPLGLKMLNELCNAGEPYACASLGEFHLRSLYEVAKDEARAKAFYQRSCALGNRDICAKFEAEGWPW